MHVDEAEEPTGAVSAMDQVIVPKMKAASTCPIPLCQSCQHSCTWLCKPKLTKSKAIGKVEGAILREQYQKGDSVSTNQYVVWTPGQLKEGYGSKAYSNVY